MRISIITSSILIAFTVVLASDTALAAVAGRVQFVAGDVQILGLHGSSRVATKGTEVHAGETILTGVRGSAQLRMIDNGFISVRSRSELKIDEYRYNGSKSDSSFFSLVRGNFRALTGMIAKFNRKAWKTRTPTAVLGVRGSDADIGFQPGRQLTAVRTYTGGYTLTPRDTSLPPLNVDAGGIGVFLPGSAPMMAASFPFEPPAPQPQPGGGASPHDQPSPDAPPEDERPLPPPPSHVPGAAPDPVASSTTVDSVASGSGLPPLPDQFQISSGTTSLTTPATTSVATAAPLDSGGVGALMYQDSLYGPFPSSGSVVIDGVSSATVGANGELFSVNASSFDGGTFVFDSGTAVLTSGMASIPSLGGTPAYTTHWGVWNGNYTAVDAGVALTKLSGFNYAWGDRITTSAELLALTGLGFTYNMLGGSASNEVGAAASSFSVTATGSFDGSPFLGFIDVSTTANFPTGSTNWSGLATGDIVDLIGPWGVSGIGTCTGCSGATAGPGSASAHADGQFVGTKAEGLLLGVHGSDFMGKGFVGTAVLKR